MLTMYELTSQHHLFNQGIQSYYLKSVKTRANVDDDCCDRSVGLQVGMTSSVRAHCENIARSHALPRVIMKLIILRRQHSIDIACYSEVYVPFFEIAVAMTHIDDG